jgi:hypothetical protein
MKIARAREHLDVLRAEIDDALAAFLKTEGKLKVTVTRLGPKGRNDDLPVHLVLPLPTLRWGVIVGDVVHNLRSALDNAVEELTVTHHGGPLPATAFPVFRSRRRFHETTPGGDPALRSGLYKIRGVAPASAKLVEAEQPFHARDPERTALWQLNALWNLDKHRITPIVATRSPYPEFAFPEGLPGHDGIAPGTVIGWDEAGDAFARSDRTKGVRLQLGFDMKPVFGPGVAEGERVLPKLEALHAFTLDLLERLAASAGTGDPASNPSG